jgi:translocation and assembly module TamB
MRWLAILLICLPAMAMAQEDDRGFIQGLLEDALSGEGRVVRIEGFAGALSSRATIERITVSDAEGAWLTAEGLALVWSRAALLQRRIEIDEITAARITLARAPIPAGGVPAPEAATPFSLPQLPVAITLGSLDITRAEIGAPILGEDAVFAISGNATLAEGDGSARLRVTRTDRAAELEFEGRFANETRALSVRLDYAEPSGGIAANALGLDTGAPVALILDGDGTTEDFAGRFGLTTDGVERLAGTLTIAGQAEAATAFALDAAGDLAPLVAPDYRAFLGPRIALRLAGQRDTDGAVAIETLSLAADALNVTGRARIGADGWPDRLDLTGRVAAADGAPVLLPLPGAPVRVAEARLDAAFDASQSDSWRADLALDGLDHPELAFATARLSGAGRIDRADEQVTGALELAVAELAPRDPALAAAIGDALRGALDIDWRAGAPVALEAIDLAGADYALTGSLVLDGTDQGIGLTLAPRLRLEARDLSRFAALSGLSLSGGAGLSIAGTAEPLRGAFDLTLEGETRDLATGIAALDPALSGAGELALSAQRDETGLTIDPLRIETTRSRIVARGDLQSDAGALSAELRLSDLGAMLPGLTGAATLSAEATRREAGPWQITLDTAGPGDSRLAVSGSVAADAATADLRAEGTAPLTLLNPFIAPQSLRGQARIDLAIAGPLAPDSVTGSITASGAQLAVPAARLSVSDLDARIDLAAGRARLDIGGALPEGGTLGLAGPIELRAPFPATLEASLRNARFSDDRIYDALVNADLTLAGGLMATPALSGTVTLESVELRIPQIGPSFTMLEGLRHDTPPSAVRRTLAFAGQDAAAAASGGGGPGLPVDIRVDAPNRIFVRGRGLDAELGGSLRLTGTTTALIPQGQFDLVRGRLDLLGQRLTLAEAAIALRGSFDPVLRVLAEAEAEDATIQIMLDGVASDPELTVSASPPLPQDEALALLLFGRSATQLSALQAVRLAAALRTLSGQGGTGFVDTLRSGLRLVDLDVQTDAEGNTEARVGAYLSENLYTDVTVGSDGQSTVTLNLDVTDNVIVRGRVDSDGTSGIGLFFERDY